VILSEPVKVFGGKVIEVLVKEEPGIVACSIAIAIAFHILV